MRCQGPEREQPLVRRYRLFASAGANRPPARTRSARRHGRGRWAARRRVGDRPCDGAELRAHRRRIQHRRLWPKGAGLVYERRHRSLALRDRRVVSLVLRPLASNPHGHPPVAAADRPVHGATCHDVPGGTGRARGAHPDRPHDGWRLGGTDCDRALPDDRLLLRQPVLYADRRSVHGRDDLGDLRHPADGATRGALPGRRRSLPACSPVSP